MLFISKWHAVGDKRILFKYYNILQIKYVLRFYLLGKYFLVWRENIDLQRRKIIISLEKDFQRFSDSAAEIGWQLAIIKKLMPKNLRKFEGARAGGASL